jgi:hypothetical protein
VVHLARQVENAGVGLFAIVPTGLVRIFHFPSVKRRAIGIRPSRSSLRSFTEKGDYVILIQENT